MSIKALIIDDETDICELLDITLTRMGISCDVAYTVADAKYHLANHQYDVCLTDLRLPDGDGIELLHWIKQHHEDLPTLMFTAHGNIDTATAAMKAGAFDFVSKPSFVSI